MEFIKNMRIYYYTPETDNPRIQQNYAVVLDILKRAGVLVMSNKEEQMVAEFTKDDLEKINMTGENLLDKMDGLVIEASTADSEIGYLLAYAISQKKPVLYLYEKRIASKGNLLYISKKNTPPFVFIKPYQVESDLQKLVGQFISSIETGERFEMPTIKFTLRITPRMENYLNWKSRRIGKKKADFLRKMIDEEIIKKDTGYQEYIKNKGNKLD